MHKRALGLSVVLAMSAAFFFRPIPAAANPGLSTQDLTQGPTAPDLASALVGEGVSVSNVTFTGALVAGGTFTGGESIVGFDEGVILSSGAVASVVGPNQSDSITTSNGTAGDPDLASLVGGATTFDAGVLAFDFVPDASTVFFRYVFASDEYNEYVGTGFNDVFGFFVNGTNCAMVNSAPVSINTVNGGNPFGMNASHPELYRNNDPNDPGPAGIDTEMDGLTTVLTCEAPVEANATNSMKLAIADVGDSIIDSNVFIEAASLTTTPPTEAPGAPTDVQAIPGNGTALLTWSPPASEGSSPISGYEASCTADGHPTGTATTQGGTAAQVSPLDNATEYSCTVRAQNDAGFGPASDPVSVTPSDAAGVVLVDPSVGGTLNVDPTTSDLGTSARIDLPAQTTAAAASAPVGDPVIVQASLFGTPGEVDATCGGRRCIGQGLDWSISEPTAFGTIRVTFFEDRSLVLKKLLLVFIVPVYKNGVRIPNCWGRTTPPPQFGACVESRRITHDLGWKITILANGDDPKGRI
jgi:hypothetical protein